MRNDDLVTIIIATHKPYKMPADSMYLPVHVGAQGKMDAAGQPLDLGFVKDNTGDNISSLNPSFCELTGMYWAWKNLDSAYLGLAHYRRHFSLGKRGRDPFDSILRKDELEPLLSHYSVIVPKKRKYYIETLYSHYAHTHYAEQLDKTYQIIGQLYPEYLNAYDRVVNRTYGHMFNMMIMRRDLFGEYCQWLFDILFALKEQLNMPELSFFQGRFYGRISEIIFNVWLEQQLACGRLKKDEIKEIPCIHMERINWWKKGTAFLKAKFLHKRYGSSF